MRRRVLYGLLAVGMIMSGCAKTPGTSELDATSEETASISEERVSIESTEFADTEKDNAVSKMGSETQQSGDFVMQNILLLEEE